MAFHTLPFSTPNLSTSLSIALSPFRFLSLSPPFALALTPDLSLSINLSLLSSD